MKYFTLKFSKGTVLEVRGTFKTALRLASQVEDERLLCVIRKPLER